MLKLNKKEKFNYQLNSAYTEDIFKRKKNQQKQYTKLFLLIATCILLCFGLMACHPERKFHERQTIKSSKWEKKQVLDFEINIENNINSYNLVLDLRYFYGYYFNNLVIKLQETSPSGKETTMDFDLVIREKNGDYLGDIAGDFCDLLIPLKNKINYKEKGIYKYRISHIMEENTIPLIDEVGLILEDN